MNATKRTQRAIRVQIYYAASPTLKYPSLVDTEWYLPIVRQWSRAYEPPDLPPGASAVEWNRYRWQLKLTGKRVVPDLVELRCFANTYLDTTRRFLLEDTLYVRTSLYWLVDYTQLDENRIILERTSPPMPEAVMLDEYERRRRVRPIDVFSDGADVRESNGKLPALQSSYYDSNPEWLK